MNGTTDSMISILKRSIFASSCDTKSETVDAPIINNFPPRTKRQSDKLSLTALNITCLILYGILPIHVVTAWADSSGNVLPDIGSAPLQLMILP